MNELNVVRDPPPRDDGTVKWLAGGFDSLGGWFLYGFMWFCVSIAFVVLVPDHVVPKGFGDDHLGLVLLVSFMIPWIPFVAWVRRRRGGVRRLFREGVLQDARITACTLRTKRGVDGTEVQVAFDGGGQPRSSTVFLFGHHTQLAVGGTLPLLHEPRSPYVALFPTDGPLVAASWSKG